MRDGKREASPAAETGLTVDYRYRQRPGKRKKRRRGKGGGGTTPKKKKKHTSKQAYPLAGQRGSNDTDTFKVKHRQ